MSEENTASNSFLVTGSTGQVGLAVIKRLRQEDIEIYALVRPDSPTGCIEMVYQMGCRIVEGDIRDPSTYMQTLKKVTGVIHAAAVVAPDVRSREIEEVNVEGTRQLVSAMKEAGVKRLIFISTVGVYDDMPDRPITEDDRLNPRSMYSKSKLKAEEIILSEEELEPSIVRCAYIIGDHNRNTIPEILRRLDRRFVFKTTGGIGKIAFLHVEDLSRFILLLVARDRTEYKVFNLQSGYFTFEEIVRVYSQVKNKHPRMIPLPRPIAIVYAFFRNIWRLVTKKTLNTYRRLQEISQDRIFDTYQAEDELGWQSQFTHNMLLDELQEFMRKHQDDRLC